MREMSRAVSASLNVRVGPILIRSVSVVPVLLSNANSAHSPDAKFTSDASEERRLKVGTSIRTFRRYALWFFRGGAVVVGVAWVTVIFVEKSGFALAFGLAPHPVSATTKTTARSSNFILRG